MCRSAVFKRTWSLHRGVLCALCDSQLFSVPFSDMTAPLRKFLLARRLLRQRWGIMIQRQPICVRCKAPLARVHPVVSLRYCDIRLNQWLKNPLSLKLLAMWNNKAEHVPQESMMAMAVLTVIILGPSFWIFAHLEPYKARKWWHGTVCWGYQTMTIKFSELGLRIQWNFLVGWALRLRFCSLAIMLIKCANFSKCLIQLEVANRWCLLATNRHHLKPKICLPDVQLIRFSSFL